MRNGINSITRTQQEEQSRTLYHALGTRETRNSELISSQRNLINREAPGNFLGQNPANLVSDDINNTSEEISSNSVTDINIGELNTQLFDRTLLESVPRLETDQNLIVNNIINLENSDAITNNETFNVFMRVLSSSVVTDDVNQILTNIEQRGLLTEESNRFNREFSNIIATGSRDLINNNRPDFQRANELRRNAFNNTVINIHVPLRENIINEWFINLFGLYPSTVLIPLYDLFYSQGGVFPVATIFPILFSILRPYFITFFPIVGFNSSIRMFISGFLRAVRILRSGIEYVIPARPLNTFIERIDNIHQEIRNTSANINRETNRALNNIRGWNNMGYYTIFGILGGLTGSLVYLGLQNPQRVMILTRHFRSVIERIFANPNEISRGGTNNDISAADTISFFRENMNNIRNYAENVDWINNFNVFLEHFQRFF